MTSLTDPPHDSPIEHRSQTHEELLRFRAAMDMSGDAIYLVDRTAMRIVDVNQTACTRMGYSREELLTMGPQDLLAAGREEIERVYDEVIAAGANGIITESSARSRDGRASVAELHRRALRSGEGWIIVSIARDITRRKRAEQALRESEARFRSLSDMSSDFYWESDVEHRLTQRASANRKLSTVSAFQRGAQIGERRWEIPYLTPDEAGWRAHRAVLDAHLPFRGFDLSRLGADGTARHISLSGDPVFDGSGAFKGYRGIGTDVTERRNAERALQESERKYRRIYDSLQDVYFETALDGTIREISPQIEILTRGQYKRDDFPGRSAAGFYADPHRYADFTRALKERGQVADFEMSFLNRDGSEVPCSVSAKVLRDADGRASGVVSTLRDISERRRVEKKLRERDARLRLLTENIPAAIAYVDRDQIVQVVNQRFIEFHRGAGVEVIGRHVRDVVGEKAWPEVERHDAKVLAGEPVVYERALDRPGGERREIEVHLEPHPSPGGEVHGFYAIILDITERKRASEALRESEARFRATFEQAAVGVAQVATDGRWLRVNQRLCDIVGYTREELLARSFHDITHPDDLDADLGYLRQALAGEISTYSMEKRYLRRGGAPVWINLTVSLVRKDSGEPDYLISVIEDITVRKSAEEARAQLAAIVETSGDAIISRAPDGTILSWNEAARRIFGFSAAEAIGSNIAIIAPPEHRHESQRNTRMLQRGKPVPPFETVRLAKDGSRVHVQISVSGIQDAAGKLASVASIFRDITERKRAEKKLRKRDAHLHLLTENIPAAVAYVDRDLMIQVANQRYAELFCAAGVEVIGRPLREVVGERAWPEVSMRVAKVFAGEPVVYERTHERPDGERCEIEVHFEPDRSPGGEVRGYYAFVLDITESKRAREALRESEVRFRATFEQAAVGVAHVATDGRWVRVNQRLCDIAGYTREELLARTFQEITHPDDLDADLGYLRRTLAGEIPTYSMEKRFVRKHGKLVWINLTISLVRKNSGEPDYLIAVIEDIAVRKRAEDALRASEEKFSKAFHGSPDSIVLSNLETGEFLEVSPGFERLSGHSRGEAIGRTALELDLWTQPGQRAVLSKRLASGEAVHNLETMLRRKDGELRTVILWLDAVDLGGEKCMLTIGRDVTEHRQAEKERAALESQLRQSQKMEAVGTLAGGIAHDFNNIIGAILGNIELAREDIGAGHPALESIAEIDKAGRRARDLVQQILVFGRRQAPERKVIALAPGVEESARLLRATLPAGVSLSVACAPDAPAVMADAMQIEQVLVNLGTNAWHAMEGRPGRLDIHLDRVDVDAEGTLRHPELQSGQYARLTVSDTGKGMEAATKERIFEPFFTTKPVGMGTGLGLSVVHGIMQGHEGAIVVDSTPGTGTTFRLYFPAADPSATAVAPANATAKAPRGSGQHVLYLDDDEALVSLVSRMLERQGYRVSGYTLAQQALDAVRAEPGGFDLVVTDYNMPRMSGLDVARELSRIRPDLPVAVTSGFITDELRERAPQFGVQHLIYKPDTADELCEVVRRLTNPAD